ncbi:MAG: DUF6364 family protein [Verrucomicrobiota bacterium]
MKTRVTITMDPEIHRLAKQAARKKRTTVSGLIEALIQSESAPQKGGIVAGMVGSASLRAPTPGSDPLYDVLQAKYIR